MVESFEAGNRGCALCRNPTPLAVEDLNRVLSEVDVPEADEAPAPVVAVAPVTAPISSFRLRHLHPSGVMNFKPNSK